ncbi:MAG: amidohydrolase family protein [Chloroflexi bacterium]|nr:amidohydrolase family protein [Chloroflexota bacterium]
MFSSDTGRYPFHPDAAYVPGPEHRSPDPLADYLQRMDAEGIDRAVLVHPEPYGDDHRLALACVALRPDLFRTTALFYPKDLAAPEKLERLLAENPGVIVAHRFHAHEGKRTYLDSFSDETARSLWEVAGAAGIVNELHIDSSYARQVEVLVRDSPSYPVLIDHLAEAKYGSAPGFGDVVALSKYPNVYMKLSGPAC